VVTLLGLVRCEEYLHGAAKARALVVPVLVVATPCMIAALSLYVGLRRGSDGTHSRLAAFLGVLTAAVSLFLAFALLVLLSLTGVFAPCA
jgi:hypothetical protein